MSYDLDSVCAGQKEAPGVCPRAVFEQTCFEKHSFDRT
jgi:hypothetical protein